MAFQITHRRNLQLCDIPSDTHGRSLKKRGIPHYTLYRGADKSLARLTSLCILFDGENISFDAIYLHIYIFSVYIAYILVCVYI